VNSLPSLISCGSNGRERMPERGLERTQKPSGNEGLDSALGDEMGDAGASGPEMPAATLAASMAERIASLPPEALRALQAMLDALTQAPR
jgi:hypothetical protein